MIEIDCCIECNLQPKWRSIIWKDPVSSHDVYYHVTQPLWQCCIIVLMFMWTYVVTLPMMRSRWTAKVIRCVGRPAVFVGPSPLTRERWVFQEGVKLLVFFFCLFLLSTPSLSYLLVFFLFSTFKFEEMNSEMEENTELADNRLIELQKLQQDLQTVHQENNSMKVLPQHSYDFQLEKAHQCKSIKAALNQNTSLLFISDPLRRSCWVEQKAWWKRLQSIVAFSRSFLCSTTSLWF